MIQIRRATVADALDVLEWRNDPHTIAMSKTPGAVERAGHVAWFEKAVKDQNRVIFIATEDGRKRGMVRFDRANEGWLVSINMAADTRRKGYGYRALKMAIDEMGQAKMFAEIRHDNLPSIRIFEKCGFHLIDAEGDWLHWVRP